MNGKNTTVRLIGVDTPETVHPSKPVEQYSKEASAFTGNLLKGEQVFVITDAQQGLTDKYGRTLAYVYRAPDGLFVNAEIVRQGYGHAYVVYPFRYMEEFRRLENLARSAQKGLWAGSPSSQPQASSQAQAAAPITMMPAQQVAPKASAVTSDNVTVYVTNTGAKYHAAGCRYLGKSAIPIKLKDAKLRYSPCSVCRPPQ